MSMCEFAFEYVVTTQKPIEGSSRQTQSFKLQGYDRYVYKRIKPVCPRTNLTQKHTKDCFCIYHGEMSQK
jgi:hypothetical protein